MDYQGNAKKQQRSPGNTSSSSSSGGEFDVFLSFCGKDTRKTFTDFLYYDLIGAGVRTFRDNEELHIGEEIGPELLKAIKVSKISIPVFSKNYASSKWCLRELAQMVECRTTLGQKILPIFYDVEPSDVRHQTGSFKQAFLNHQERFDGTIVQGWKEALTEVGKLKGWELKNETDGHEGELAKKVTMKVLIVLKKNYMDVTEDLVGIEDQVKEMEELLNAYSDAVQIVGILGMGGIGKTTLAKVIYNKISEHFESFSFLENVRERIQQHEGLLGLQNELCPNRKALDDIANADARRNMIKNTVCRKKFFIVLDDIDEKSQFDKLVKREWFDEKSRFANEARGSKIIVTTRNKQVLTLIAADSTYEPPPMKFDHSLQLFSKHAFRKDFPPEEYDTLSRKFVDTAAGLPLALELTGSHLYALNKSNWLGILEKLEKIPREDVQKKLEISYEALDDLQKQIFLDIACFLIGKEKRVAFYMWKDSKFYPEDGIDILVLRSLIKIRDDNRLWMHDQLRDMGRNIVYKENCAKPWKRSRVWSCDDAWETLERCKDTQEHEAVEVEAFKVEFKADYLEPHPPFPKEIGQLKRLRYLEVEYKEYLKNDFGKQVSVGDAYVGDFKHHFPKLRWLKWHGLFSRYRVSNFHLEKLIILDVSWSSFEDNSEWWNQIKISKNLKVLNLEHCSGFNQTPEFSTFAVLEMLILKYCSDLVKIDPLIGNLTSLRVLDISGCSITELPDAIGNLEKLEEIHAVNCEKLVGLDLSIGNLTSLRVLDISGCSSITKLPDGIENLEKLEEIDVSLCLKLGGEFPDIRRLSFLRILGLHHTGFDRLPKSICELTRLETLDVSFGNLRSLPELPSSLTCLFVTCGSMEVFPSPSSLKELIFYLCCNPVEIPTDIGKLSKLENLRFIETNISTLPAEIGDLPRLKTLKIRSRELQSIQGLPSSLITLSISGSESMETLPNLSNLKNLASLRVKRCSRLMHIKFLGKIESLTMLNVYKCKKLAEVDGLENHESLRFLIVKDCKSLYRLSDLSNLGMLKCLNLSDCQKLAKVEGLSFLKSLEALNMSFCTSLEGILDLSNLKKLRYFSFCGWKNLNVIGGFEELESLENLDISYCKIEKSPDFSNLKKLKHLKARQCEKLRSILGLGELKSLTSLDISGSSKLIENSSDLPNIEIVMDSVWPFPSEAYENEKEDASHDEEEDMYDGGSNDWDLKLISANGEEYFYVRGSDDGHISDLKLISANGEIFGGSDDRLISDSKLISHFADEEEDLYYGGSDDGLISNSKLISYLADEEEDLYFEGSDDGRIDDSKVISDFADEEEDMCDGGSNDCDEEEVLCCGGSDDSDPEEYSNNEYH